MALIPRFRGVRDESGQPSPNGNRSRGTVKATNPVARAFTYPNSNAPQTKTPTYPLWERIRQSLRSGAHPDLEAALDVEISSNLQIVQRRPARNSLVLFVGSNKGGPGKTFHSLVLSQIASSYENASVCVLELNTQNTLSRSIGDRNPRSVSDLSAQLPEVARAGIARLLGYSTVLGRVPVFTIPTDNGEKRALTTAHFLRILDTLKTHFSLIFLDGSSAFETDVFQLGLSTSDHVIWITTPEKPTYDEAMGTLNYITGEEYQCNYCDVHTSISQTAEKTTDETRRPLLSTRIHPDDITLIVNDADGVEHPNRYPTGLRPVPVGGIELIDFPFSKPARVLVQTGALRPSTAPTEVRIAAKQTLAHVLASCAQKGD